VPDGITKTPAQLAPLANPPLCAQGWIELGSTALDDLILFVCGSIPSNAIEIDRMSGRFHVCIQEPIALGEQASLVLRKISSEKEFDRVRLVLAQNLSK